MSNHNSATSINKNYNVLISLILLSSLLPIQYIGGYSIIDPMSNTLAISTANAESALFITFGLGLTLGEFFLGPLADKYGRLPIVVVCLNLYAISSLVCAIHYSPIWFLIFRTVSGFTVAAGVIIARIIISDNLSLQDGTSMLSRVRMYASILIALYPLTIQFAIDYFHLAWLSFFIFNAIFCSIVSTQALLLLNKLRSQKLNPDALRVNTIKQGLKNTLGTHSYRRPLFAFLTAAVIYNLFSFTLPIITHILHGQSSIMILAAGIGVGIATFIMLLINKTLVNKGLEVASVTNGMFIALTSVVLGIVVIFQLPLSDELHYYLFLCCYLFAIGILITVNTNLFMVCSESFDKQKVNSGFITSLTISLKGFTAFITSLLLPLLEGEAIQIILTAITISVLACTTYYMTQYKK